uniref:Sodium/glutamate symporter n=1 Tax=Cyanothece sp. (strain PCC 7425 / ATCC 29141) TaxID=395961 RepID=B8HJP4_CYAP4
MNIIALNERQTTIIAILVLYLGKYLTSRIKFLKDYNIPAAVSGGVLASLLFGLYYFLGRGQIEFTLGIRDNLLIVFFTTIGLSSKLKTLLKGGKPLLILLVAAVSYLCVQNLTGIVVAALLGMKLPIGLIAGSVSLSGGHGTAIAWAPIFKDTYGIPNAVEIGTASATFGLILGGMIGGPVAKFLIVKNGLAPQNQDSDLTVGVPHGHKPVNIDYDTMLNSLLVLGITIGLGLKLNDLTTALGLKLPIFVTCLLGGIILTNTVPLIWQRFPWPAHTPSLALISDVCLGLFLAISLMSLQLWTLVDLAGPIALILGVQFLVSVAYAILVVFPCMGKTYNAAVVSAGYLGLSLGATPTAIANMSAVTAQFGAAPQAFIIVPLVGAFFIDLANALIIQKFLNFIG